MGYQQVIILLCVDLLLRLYSAVLSVLSVTILFGILPNKPMQVLIYGLITRVIVTNIKRAITHKPIRLGDVEQLHPGVITKHPYGFVMSG